MAKFRKKIRWKSIISGVLAVLLVFGAVFGLVKLFGKDYKTISPGKWTTGDLDKNGEFLESKRALVNEEPFACDGLRIEPDFKADLTYDIYYYDVHGKLLMTVTGLDGIYEEDHPEADTCRIVIRPGVPEGEQASEFKISFWEVLGFANDLKVTVNKDQGVYATADDLITEDSFTGGAFTEANISELSTTGNFASYKSTALIKTGEKYDAYRVYVKLSTKSNDTIVAFADAQLEGEVAGEDVNTNECICLSNKNETVSGFAHVFEHKLMDAGVWYSVILEAPEAADVLRVAFPDDAEVRVYGLVK